MFEPRFGAGPVVVGLVPRQDPAVLRAAIAFAAVTGVAVAAAYVDPSSYLIEWDPDGNVLRQSMDPSIDPDDDAARTARELEKFVGAAAREHGVAYSFRTLGGEPAMALGRMAQALGASVIVVGARRPGLMNGVNELISGAVARRLLNTQHVPVLVLPRPDAHPPLHG